MNKFIQRTEHENLYRAKYASTEISHNTSRICFNQKFTARMPFLILNQHCKALFPLPELTGDRFPFPVNSGRVDGRAFPLTELTSRVDGPSTRLVETGLKTI